MRQLQYSAVRYHTQGRKSGWVPSASDASSRGWPLTLAGRPDAVPDAETSLHPLGAHVLAVLAKLLRAAKPTITTSAVGAREPDQGIQIIDWEGSRAGLKRATGSTPFGTRKAKRRRRISKGFRT